MNEAAALRYVVLRHEGIPNPHFDLMFETSPGSMLATWRSPAWPIVERVRLTELPAHRREYLTFEGELSGNRGHVRRVDAGTHTVNQPSDRVSEYVLSGTAPGFRIILDSDGQHVAEPLTP